MVMSTAADAPPARARADEWRSSMKVVVRDKGIELAKK